MVLARYTELGRIRIGDLSEIEKGQHKGKPRANKLNIFRITSNHLKILEQISGLYGGDVHEWVRPEKWKNLPYVKEPTHDFELYTTSNILDVIVPTGTKVSTVREVWDARGCAHRCMPDSREIILDDDESVIGEPCTREDCVEVARFAVMLSKIHAMGLWRLDTKGFYGASEIRGFFDIMNMCRLPLGMEATLSLEERQRKSHKKGTLNFVVPVLQPLLTPGELLQLSAAAQVPMLMGPPPTTEEAQELIAEVHGERSPAPQHYTPEKRAEPVKVLEGATVQLWEDSPAAQESKKHPLMDGVEVPVIGAQQGVDEAERSTRPSVAAILTAPEPEEIGGRAVPEPHKESPGKATVKLYEDRDQGAPETEVVSPALTRASKRAHALKATAQHEVAKRAKKLQCSEEHIGEFMKTRGFDIDDLSPSILKELTEALSSYEVGDEAAAYKQAVPPPEEGPSATPPVKSVQQLEEEAGKFVKVAAETCGATIEDIWAGVKALAPIKFELLCQQDLDAVKSLLVTVIASRVNAQPEAEPDDTSWMPEAELLAWIDAEAGRRGVEPVVLKDILTEYSPGWEGTLAGKSALEVDPWQVWAVERFDKYANRGKEETKQQASEIALTPAF